jgi:hypothetical protein
MKTNQHKNEIEVTRKGGFGGSDAKLFYKIGLKGLSALNNTDKKRIRVAKGIDEYKPVPMNEAMQRGHDFEDWYEKQPFAPIAYREAKLTANLANNFDTFFHADFSDVFNEVWELKCVQNPDNAIRDYYEQLQWQHLIGAKKLWLVVADSSQPFETGVKMPELIERNEQVIEILRNGIKLLDKNWNDINLEVGEDWTDEDLMPFEKMEVDALAKYLNEIKELEAEADRRRQTVFDFMNTNGIKSLASELYTISFIPESSSATLDKKKLFSEHPEIKETDYQKISPKKAYITVKLK